MNPVESVEHITGLRKTESDIIRKNVLSGGKFNRWLISSFGNDGKKR